MASLNYHDKRKLWRVIYTLYYPSQRKKRKEKTFKQKGPAQSLHSVVQQIEESTKAGMASIDDINSWVGRSLLTRNEANEAFPGYEESIYRIALTEERPADFDAILNAFENYLEDNTNRGMGNTNYQNSVSRGVRVIDWLKENHPSLSPMTDKDVEDYRSEMRRRGYAQWTIHHNMTTLRILLDQAVNLGMIRDNPARRVKIHQPKKQEERVIMSKEEAQWLLENSLNHRHRMNGSLPTVVRLGLYAGLRNQEMCWLMWDRIDEQRRILTIELTICPDTQEKWNPKTYEMRRIDAPKQLFDHLREEHGRQEKEKLLNPFILPAGSPRNGTERFLGRPLGRDVPQKAFAMMLKEEGKEDTRLTLYSCRHTYATMALRAGVDIRTLQHRMGHSNIQTTMEYLHYIEPEQHPMDKLPY